MFITVLLFRVTPVYCEIPETNNISVQPAYDKEYDISKSAQPLEFKILFYQNFESGTNNSSEQKATQQTQINFPVRDRQIISNEKEYRDIFKKPSEGIDWSKSRVVVFQESTTYKFDKPDSRASLSGIYQISNRIIIEMSFTHYGPVQGIRQMPEWFHYKYRVLFLLLPLKPEIIEYSYKSDRKKAVSNMP